MSRWNPSKRLACGWLASAVEVPAGSRMGPNPTSLQLDLPARLARQGLHEYSRNAPLVAGEIALRDAASDCPITCGARMHVFRTSASSWGTWGNLRDLVLGSRCSVMHCTQWALMVKHHFHCTISTRDTDSNAYQSSPLHCTSAMSCNKLMSLCA